MDADVCNTIDIDVPTYRGAPQPKPQPRRSTRKRL